MKFAKLAAIAVAFAFGSADAAVITFQTGASTAGVQNSANDYRDAVDLAVANSPYGAAVRLDNYDNVSNQSIFSASAQNIAFKSTITFGLTSAGSYAFRAGVDFGNGGAVFLDGTQVALTTHDMWWGGSYDNASQIFSITGQSLTAGNHTLAIYGLEGCCDGGQQVQFSANGGAFQSFSVNSMAPVPEPETYAMMLGGLGVVGALARRRRVKQAA